MTLTTITTFLAQHPIPVVIVLGLGYVRLFAGQWSMPMLLDAGLAALYIARPSAGMLAWALLLLGVRHVPAFAAIVAQAFKLDGWQGWSAYVLLFALPALRVYAQRPASATLPPAVGPTVALPASAAPAPARTALRPAEWLGAVNDDATAPHLGVVGPTRLGKTTFVLAALSRRAGRLVVTTPKGADTDPWGGVQARRLRADLETRGYDWSPIAAAIDGVHYEMLRRNAAARARDAEQITLVIDELSTTLANCEAKVKRQIMELWNMGAGAGIRLIVIDPEVSAAAWGVQGRRDILGNLVFARVEDGRRWTLGRLDPNGRLLDPRDLDTDQLLTLAGEAQLAGREWGGVGVPADPTPPDPAVGTGNGNVEPGTVAGNGTSIEVLRALRKAGLSRDWARAHGCIFRDTDWTEAGKP